MTRLVGAKLQDRGAGAVRVVGPLIGAHGKCSMALMGSLGEEGGREEMATILKAYR